MVWQSTQHSTAHLDGAEGCEVHLLHLLVSHVLKPCLRDTFDTGVQEQVLFHLQMQMRDINVGSRETEVVGTRWAAISPVITMYRFTLYICYGMLSYGKCFYCTTLSGARLETQKR